MENIFLYILKLVVIGAILFGYYNLFLKNRKHNQVNRLYLLLFFPLSLLLPLVHPAFIQWDLPGQSLHVTEGGWLPVAAKICVAIYFCVAVNLVFIVTKNIRDVLQLRSESVVQQEKHFWFIETSDDRAPFSFFNSLFWKKGVDRKSENGAKIFKHEMVHIKQHHSYDRLASQLICATFWMNPFFWWAQRELGTVHEFLADERSFGPDETHEFARTLLSSYSGGRYLNQHMGFSKSDIERRIQMIGRSKQKSSWMIVAKKTTVLLVFFVLILVANSYTNYRPPTADDLKKVEAFEKKLRDERSHLGQTP